MMVNLLKFKGRILLTNDSWKRRTVKLWNKMEGRIRLEDNKVAFANSLKIWVLDNVKLRL